jgi:hypothetical protein
MSGTIGRVNTVNAEVLYTGTPNGRVNAVNAEVIYSAPSNARVNFLSVEVIRSIATKPKGRAGMVLMFED